MSAQALTFTKFIDTLDQVPEEAGKKFTFGVRYFEWQYFGVQ